MDWTSEIRSAAQRIAPYARRTPTVVTPAMGRHVAFKLEHMQHTGSFKARGAFNTLLTQPVPAAGIVAASGGNHGAAVAYAARTLGHPARIYVPEMAGPSKIALIRNQGADLVVVPGTYADALSQAQEFETKTGAMQIHAYDAPGTVIGQGTTFLEWEDQGLEADTILIAVGGGGLIGGAMAWLGGRRNIIAVEPECAPTLNRALRDGLETTVEVSGIAANALGARKIGTICYDLAQKFPVQSVLVTDDAIATAQKSLWRDMRILVEPAGAAALAALQSGAYTPQPDERVAILLCGANPAPDPFE